MSMITDAIMKQMGTIGEPRTSTMTENIEQTSNQPMNFGNLALMLWLIMGDKSKAGTTSALGETPMPPPLSVSQPTGMPGITPSPTGAGLGAQSNPMELIQILLKAMGGGVR